ncbi:MAG: hypothetical protein ACT4RN_00295 [Pseudonocardia sp.]
MSVPGFTVLRCAASGCGSGDPCSTAGHALAALRDAVTASEHGVLVTTGCLLGYGSCGHRPTAPVVLVQPCNAERRPTRPAVLVGPLRTEEDVESVGAWLRAARFDGAQLPPHLLELHRRLAATPRR